MDKEIEKEFLNTTTLEEFKDLLKKYNIKDIKQLTPNILLHHNNLGSKNNAEKHFDPRKK